MRALPLLLPLALSQAACTGESPAKDGEADADADTTPFSANQVTVDGTVFVYDGTTNLNDGGGFVLYTGATSDWSVYTQLSTVTEVGATSCGANLYLTMTVTVNNTAYAWSNAGSTCTIDVTAAPAGRGEHYTGTYEAELYGADGRRITVTGGRFDVVYP